MSPQQGGGGDKTEKATPKKRRDAREKGQIFKSTDVVIAGSMLILLAALKALGPFVITNTMGMMKMMFSYPVPQVVDAASLRALAIELIVRFVIIILPLLGVALITGVIFNIMQVGFLFAPKALAPKFSRISMIEGFKRIFSKRTLIELLKSIIKLTVLIVVAYNEYQNQMQPSSNMMSTSLETSVEYMIDMIFNVGFRLALALIIMAPFDLLYQWWRHEKDLMMTKQEVKDEYKLTEGDPQIKGRIRQKQRQMSAMRMMQAISGADVVITNPTHYAIALSYKAKVNAAPIVVAKGKDYLAQKIKEEALKHGIEMVENRPLARQLYFYCEVGEEVPQEMYQAVAEILAYIYGLQKQQARRGVR